MTTSVKPKLIFKDYLSNRRIYVKALSDYAAARGRLNLDFTKDQEQWQIQEPVLADAVDAAYETWRAEGAAQVEQALAIMESSINDIVANVIADSKKTMLDNKMASNVGKAPWYMSYATPSNWYGKDKPEDEEPSFSDIELKSNYLAKSEDTNYTKYSAEGSAKMGLWSVSTEVSGESKESHKHMVADDFTLTAQIAVVQINRPWLNDLIFKMSGWSLDKQGAGHISNGVLKDNETNLLPLIPTAFIVARNITIEANFTTEDKKVVEDSFAANASVSWGPIAVSGKYAHGSSSDRFESTFNGGVLTVPGIQIIGYVNEIIPFSAPLVG